MERPGSSPDVRKAREALRGTYGQKRQYIVVEDGDTKGYQSSAGKQTKRAEKITSMMLPPRSPGWMPLDYSIWREIDRRVLAKQGKQREAMGDF